MTALAVLLLGELFHDKRATETVERERVIRTGRYTKRMDRRLYCSSLVHCFCRTQFFLDTFVVSLLLLCARATEREQEECMCAVVAPLTRRACPAVPLKPQEPPKVMKDEEGGCIC